MSFLSKIRQVFEAPFSGCYQKSAWETVNEFNENKKVLANKNGISYGKGIV